MSADTSKIQTDSQLQGLGYLPPQSNSLNVSSFSLGATTASSFYLIELPISVNDAATTMMINFNGVSNSLFNNKWFIINGSMYFRNTEADVLAKIVRGTGNIGVSWQYYNSSGTSKTVPAQTVSIRCFPYTAPWD